jgi:hypothetical protein
MKQIENKDSNISKQKINHLIIDLREKQKLNIFNKIN